VTCCAGGVISGASCHRLVKGKEGFGVRVSLGFWVGEGKGIFEKGMMFFLRPGQAVGNR